ncbi:GFA family protein [Solimonas sp. K1W22B-7]|uniref:GFA family protein n=1 Tax=Solimonas sp. K1W22B-7 TaxID=2303331 RepID=UPI000E334C21|nr:GFA family protein [Solimonas sp. K1W22B-7]AXQ29979.1 GFA family protein [Solimonas sp. K1W22B-7]
MLQSHQGSCHCGRVTFEMQAQLDHVVDCNCSICRRKGALWHAVPDAGLRILSGEEELSLYQFNTQTAKHYFCRTCGVHPFTRPRINPSLWVVNVRCIGGVDLSALEVRPFDGANWETAAGALLRQRGQA